MAKTKILKTIFKLRRGKASLWASVNPVLEEGEPAFETDTGGLKIGNGSSNYIDLPYINGGNVDILVDGESIKIKDGKIEILGFTEAEVGQFLCKGEDGSLVWKNSLTDALTNSEVLEILD